MRLEEYYILKKIDDELKEVRFKYEELFNLIMNNTLQIKNNSEDIRALSQGTQKEGGIGFEQ